MEKRRLYHVRHVLFVPQISSVLNWRWYWRIIWASNPIPEQIAIHWNGVSNSCFLEYFLEQKSIQFRTKPLTGRILNCNTMSAWNRVFHERHILFFLHLSKENRFLVDTCNYCANSAKKVFSWMANGQKHIKLCIRLQIHQCLWIKYHQPYAEVENKRTTILYYEATRRRRKRAGGVVPR